jgi:D-glycero-alpha-D-manno-heptose-7-phosphate kinase
MSRSEDLVVRAEAPLRISFVGGGTDLPHWFERNGGAVLSATIDQRARVTIVSRADRQVTIRSLDLGHRVGYHLDRGPVYDGVMDLPKAAIARMGVEGGVDVDIASDAPPGSGLGGSSALVTAMVAGLAALARRPMSADEVARTAYAIEREDLGIAGGWQDQYASVLGGVNLLEFSSDGVRATPLGIGDGALRTLAEGLLLCYTGSVRTDLGLIHTQIRLYREGREETIQGMKQLQSMAYEMRDTLEAGRFRDLGPMLAEAYESKKRMNPDIARGTAIERLFELARGAGSTGGKICGAGGGGYVLLACPPDRSEAVREALAALGVRFAPFRFVASGVRARVRDRVWSPT